MNPHRRLFAWYLAVWFVAALAPAAYAVASFYGMDGLRSAVEKAIGAKEEAKPPTEPPLPSLEPANIRNNAPSYSVRPLALKQLEGTW